MFDLERIGRGLAVQAILPELPSSGAQVIQAPPGTGKTTLIPPALANLHPTGRVLVVAPRRVAVRAAARRLCELSGLSLGREVGFSVRGEHHAGSAVHFMTPRILLNRLIADPELADVAAVVIDEVHERSIDTDVLVAMLSELRQLREDLQLVCMSATLDSQEWAQLIGADCVLKTEAQTHPIEVEWVPTADASRLRCDEKFLDHIARCAREAVAAQEHSVLVFVPGVREVEEVCRRLGDKALPLHGRLGAQAQDAALKDTPGQRIVVATAVAESSLTVPGVRAVVDSGLSRVPRRDRARGMSGLITISEARATAIQRAGRAGREGPGRVWRCFREEEFRHFAEHPTPEIKSADLSDIALHLACWGTPRGEGLALMDAPPEAAMADAEAVLRAIGAVDEAGLATEHGRELAKIPLDPRQAHALLTLGAGAAETLAILAEGVSGEIRVAPSKQAKREARRLARMVDDAGKAHARKANAQKADAGVVVGTAYPDYLARRVAGSDEYLLASGTRANLGRSGLAPSPWLAIGEINRSGHKATIRSGTAISEAAALEIIGVEETLEATVEKNKISGVKVRRAGAIELSRTNVAVPADKAAAALMELVKSAGVQALFSPEEEACALRDRLVYLHQHCGQPWPDPDEVDPELWLGPEIEQVARGKAPGKIRLLDAYRRLLPWPEAARLEELAPARLAVPSGRSAWIDYSEGRPIVQVKLQECFGLASSPEILGVPVLFHLLSPAGRPVAITDDLKSFWSGPYAQVRAEMRGRYPKHPWPEDPWSAQATHRTKGRGKA